MFKFLRKVNDAVTEDPDIIIIAGLAIIFVVYPLLIIIEKALT